MYGYPSYNQHLSVDRINAQINDLERLKAQAQSVSQPAINQTFQLAPSNQGGIRYVDSIDEVSKELVFGDTVFFSKDFSQMWLKNVKGEVKTYSLTEIVQKDEKDLMIEELKNQIADMKKEMEEYGKYINNNVDESVEGEESSNVQRNRTTKTK